MYEPRHRNISAPDRREGADPGQVEQLRVIILGVNAWAVVALLPLLLAGPHGIGSVAIASLPLLVLASGAMTLERLRGMSAVLLLAAFPAVLAAVVAALPRLAQQDPASPLGLVLGALSVLTFGAQAAAAVSRPVQLRATRERPLGAMPPLPRGTRRWWRQRALLALVGSGALAVAVLGPTLGGPASLVNAWGDAAREAALLTAVCGGALGAGAVALVVAPAMRANRSRPPSNRIIGLRVLGLLLAVAAGTVVYFVVTT